MFEYDIELKYCKSAEQADLSKQISTLTVVQEVFEYSTEPKYCKIAEQANQQFSCCFKYSIKLEHCKFAEQADQHSSSYSKDVWVWC